MSSLFSLYKGKYKRKSFKGENNPNYKDGRTLKQYLCECGNKMSRGAKRCSKCADKIQSLKIRGKNNPFWKDGGSFQKYPKKFNSKLKYSIRERDNFECQNCNMTEEEHIIVVGRVLTIHHIDYNKQNCKKINLITTCLWCNVRANKNRPYWLEFYKKVLDKQERV